MKKHKSSNIKKGRDHQNKANSLPSQDLNSIEDKLDLTCLNKIAAKGTRKAYNTAIKTGQEVMLVKDGNLIRKRAGMSDEIISKIKTRTVKVGTKSSL